MNQPQGIYDARQLGRPKMFVLGAQHMFAMFGATVLVPALTGMSVSATLLFAGLGTLLFHFLTKWKVPAFLGSSFAFIGGYQAIAPMIANEDGSLSSNTEMLPYACFGVVLAGLLYVVLAALFKVFGTKAVMRYFPPIVTGPIIICIGLTLSSTAITNCRSNWAIALVAIAIVVVCNIWGKGMVKIIPILLGVVGSYGVAAVCQAAGMEVMDPAKVQALLDAPWIGLPFRFEDTLFGLFSRPNVDLGGDHYAPGSGHHGGAHRRHLCHLLHLRTEFPPGPGPPPHPAGRRHGHLSGRSVRGPGQHHLRREHRRAGPVPGL